MRIQSVFAVIGLLLSSLSPGQSAVEELGGGGRPVGPIFSRSPVYGEHGMAATAQPPEL